MCQLMYVYTLESVYNVTKNYACQVSGENL